MGSYKLQFFGDDDRIAASISINALSEEAAVHTATHMLQNTRHALVEVWEGANLLHLVGRNEERKLA